MKNFLSILTLFLLSGISVLAQVGINTDFSMPDPSAILDVKSTDKGILVPRMTLAQRNNIVNPAAGLIIYQTDNSPGLYYNSGSSGSPVWVLAVSGTSWGLTGNSGTNPAGNFIGTTDNVPLSFRVNNQAAGKIDQFLLNSSFGYQSLNPNTSGNNNTAFGHNALFSNTAGEQNTANGSHTLYLNTTGSYNTANGYAALINNLSGDRNTATGFGALLNNSTGYSNTSTGFASLYYNLTGNFNTSDGFESLNSNNDGDGNTATGYQSLANSNGSFNTALGYMAGASNTSGQQNTYIGANASGSSGMTNATAIGYNAQVNQSNSLVLGYNANVGIGTSSPQAALEISSNTKGFLPPRMTEEERDLISAVEGLIIYNKSSKRPNYYDGTNWMNYDFTIASQIPVLTTTEAYSIHGFDAASGGNIITAGTGGIVSVRGVCWSTSENPTIDDSKTIDGSGAGIFTSSITGLTLGVTYYVRAYATNAIGTGYGNQINFTTVLSIGTSYLGGKIAYILQPGDPGYDPNTIHGLIIADFDIVPDYIGAEWGCKGTLISGADGTAFGTGNQNTIDIMAGCATEYIAARYCGNWVYAGYSDWYLPSKDELNKLFINKAAIGGSFAWYYWSSTEFDSNLAWLQSFSSGEQSEWYKDDPTDTAVRPIRSF